MQTTRWAGIAAIVFAVLLAAGFLFASDTPDGDASNQTVAAYWNDGGNEAEAIISAYILSVSAIALVTFTTLAFRARGGGHLVAIARSLGLVVATAFGIGAFALAAPAASALFDNATISAEGSSVISSLGFGMMTRFGAITAAAMIAAIRSSGCAPRRCPRGFRGSGSSARCCCSSGSSSSR